jgi:putative transposase
MPENSFDSATLFKGRQFDSSIIILCVRLICRDLRDMMAERGIDLVHTTILRWVQRYVPEFEKWNCYARPVGSPWRVDETYVRVKGEWRYLYRAVDKQGNTVDFLLSERRDIAAAKRPFSHAIEECGVPEKITVDAYPATHRAITELKQLRVSPPQVVVRTSKYLNNLIEQDHRRVNPMLGFKRFENAAVTISGIELVHKIRKAQFDTSATNQQGVRVQKMWEVVLAG